MLLKMKNAVFWQIVGIVGLVFLIIVEILFIASDTPKKALKKENFENIKVTAYEQRLFNDGDIDSATELSARSEFGEMIIQEHLAYNRTDLYEVYFEEKDDKHYMYRYVKGDLLSDEVAGQWQRTENEESDVYVLIDLNAIFNLTKEDFQKQEDYYILKDNEQQVFCQLLQTSQTDKYVCDYIRFYFEKGKLTQLELAYYYGNNMYYAYEYEFEYGKQEVTLPEINNKQ